MAERPYKRAPEGELPEGFILAPGRIRFVPRFPPVGEEEEQDLMERHFEAIERGDFEALYASLALHGVDPELEARETGETPLCRAAWLGDEDAIHMLVHLGASVNHETSTGTTALFEAAKAREEGAIRALVDCGACANFETSHGETALTQLINSLSEDFLDSVRVRRLRDRRDMTAGGLFTVVPVSDSESDDGADAADAEEAARALEPVGDAAGNSDGGSDGAASGDAAHADTADQQEQQEDQVREATVEEEVEEEVDEEEELHYILYGVRSVRRTRRQRRTAARGELASVLRVLQLLVAEGAEVNRETSSGDSPLLRACALGALPIVDVLLRSGADMDHRSQTGLTPLHKAIGAGATDVVAALLQRGADPRQRTRRGVTPLLLAAQLGHRRVGEMLLSLRSTRRDVDYESADGRTALTAAAGGGHEEMVKMLIRKGANVTRETLHGTTALHAACRCDRGGIVRALLDAGAAPDAMSRLAPESLTPRLLAEREDAASALRSIRAWESQRRRARAAGWSMRRRASLMRAPSLDSEDTPRGEGSEGGLDTPRSRGGSVSDAGGEEQRPGTALTGGALSGESALADVSSDALRDDYDALDRRHSRRTDHSTTSLRRTIQAQAEGKGPRIEALEQQQNHHPHHRQPAHRHSRGQGHNK